MFDDHSDRNDTGNQLRHDLGGGVRETLSLDMLTQGELLTLRADIDSRLDATALQDMDLEKELVLQYQTAKALQLLVLDSHEEANKKAQVMNTCANTLQSLVKMQAELHTAERLKAIEARLIRALDRVPQEHLEEFFGWYENEQEP